MSAMLVLVLWRALRWPYRREVTLAFLLVVMIVVTAYRNGALRRHPGRVLTLAVVFTALGAVIGHIPV